MGGFPRVIVDLEALSHNLEKIRSKAAGCRVMAVVKANAYGHGLVAVARALSAADALAVARIDEALSLREAGVGNAIVLLEGVFNEAEMALAAQHDLTLVVHNEDQLGLLESYPGKREFRCWLKVDTGMHRLGFTTGQARNAMARLLACKAARGPADGRPGLMTHLASSELPADEGTAEQLRVFSELADGWPGAVSIANSAAILLRPATCTGWVRPGLALYGASPVPGTTGHDFGFRPAMKFVTRLISIKTVPAGGRVGYNGAWAARTESRVGIAAAGYGDGYLRSMKNGTPVMVEGQRGRLVGRVSMDMIAIDLGSVKGAQEGSEVLLWGGEGLAVEEVAEYAGSIPYELLCNVSARVVTEYEAGPEALA